MSGLRALLLSLLLASILPPPAAHARRPPVSELSAYLPRCASADDAYCQHVALQLIGHGDRAIPDLVKLYPSLERSPRLLALHVLVELDTPRARKAMMLMYAVSWPTERIMILQALAADPGRKVTRFLIRAASAKDTAVRKIAVRVLGRRPGKAVRSAVRKRLDDREPQVRVEALYAVGTLGIHAERKRCAEILAKVPERETRRAAAYALRFVASRPQIPLLIDALRDRDDQVRAHVLSALRRITRVKFGPDWRLWREWFQTNGP